eukprot:4759903-Prymnesium_polylepis.1
MGAFRPGIFRLGYAGGGPYLRRGGPVGGACACVRCRGRMVQDPPPRASVCEQAAAPGAGRRELGLCPRGRRTHTQHGQVQ